MDGSRPYSYVQSLLFTHIFQSNTREETLRDFRKNSNILHCTKNKASAWTEVTKSCTQGTWKKNNLKRFNNFERDEQVNGGNRHVAELANMLELEVDGIQESVEYKEGELTNKDLIQLEAQQHLEQGEEVERTEDIQKKFTVQELASVFS